MPRWSEAKAALVLLCGLLTCGCHSRPAGTAQSAALDPSCEERKAQLIELLRRLPERAWTPPTRVDLPVSSLEGVFGSGPILEVSGRAVVFKGEPIAGPSTAEQAAALRERFRDLADWSHEASAGAAHNDSAQDAAGAPTLSVAAARDLTVRALRNTLASVPSAVRLRLLFTRPATAAARSRSQTASDLAVRMLAEPDAATRGRLAAAAYSAATQCADVQQAATAAGQVDVHERWARLRPRLIEALPRCRCEQLDTEGLQLLLVAEQRAGAASLGSLPLSFIRDERCGASMPLRSVQKLLTQIEAFDAEFAGAWSDETLSFTDVITNERLLNQFCDALPGETLSSVQRARATLYWQVASSKQCQAWQFGPLARGAPMGTWSRVPAAPNSSASALPLAFHYWQGAEEIRVYGPVPEPATKPTDQRTWDCQQEFKMVGVDAESIRLEHGRWYFAEAACRAAPAAAALFPGCVSAWAARGDAEEPGQATPPDGATPGD